MMIEIDRDRWKRNEIFTFFSTLSNPFYTLSYREDVTKLVRFCKKNKTSFYFSMIYLAAQTINSIEAFRYLIDGEKVFLIEERIPSFTVLNKGEELFRIITLPAHGTMNEFVRLAEEKSRKQRFFIDLNQEQGNLIYFSCTPWMEMTSVTSERELNKPGSRDDTIPHITWGKYHAEQDRIIMDISLEVNHRMIDGYHIGLFHKNLTEAINSLD